MLSYPPLPPQLTPEWLISGVLNVLLYKLVTFTTELYLLVGRISKGSGLQDVCTKLMTA
jgi:hypothetical protein